MFMQQLRSVLVVEDEALLRMMAVEIAEEAGFDVIEASNADEAVKILAARSDVRIVFSSRRASLSTGTFPSGVAYASCAVVRSGST